MTRFEALFDAQQTRGTRRTPRTRRDAASRSVRASATLLAGVAFALALALPVQAGPREQAKLMHDRLVGAPPSAGVLDAMATSIAGNDAIGAAYQAMADPLFYSSTLKNFVTPWTNTDASVFQDLNDFTATVIGLARDEAPFTDVLSADVVYTGVAGVVATPYSHTDNDHYRELERDRVDLSDPNFFSARTQSGLPGSALGPGDAAGIITTRAGGEAFFSAGTNRRMIRFLALNFMCRDLEELNDITRPADRVRQDITRSPGGDSRIFHNTCVGCHSGMDPLAGAFAFLQWDEDLARVVFTRGQVQGKYLINDNTFPGGYRTVDDRWDNYWRNGQNGALGWGNTPGGGNGPRTLGAEIAQTSAFSECQVEKVFERVCLRPPGSPADRTEVQRIANVFEAQNYSLKRVFAETAVFCMGQ